MYLDNNATTQPDPRVIDAMARSMRDDWGNPSSTHRFGQQARRDVELAREQVARLLCCPTAYVLFTAGGTEASNTAIRSLHASRQPRRRVVTSSVEHSATRETIRQLAREGACEVVEVGVDPLGRLDTDQLRGSLDDSIALASLIWANNETGVVWPMQELVQLCREKRVPIHVDATQCVGKMPIDLGELGADMVTVAAHKFHGPKGIGALVCRRGVRLRPLLVGGPQERGRRGGTENVAGIVGMGVASEVAWEMLADMPRIARLRDRLEESILARIDHAAVHGDRASRLPNTTNIGFARLEAEPILLLLSEAGVWASAGAACSSGSLEPSHVLQAMNVDPRSAHGAIRFSLGRFNREQDVDRCLEVLPGVIERLREVLPVG